MPVFKVGTTLVRVDAVVTDKKSAQVRDLTAEDFEIEADGKPVPVRVVSYVPLTGVGDLPNDAAGPATLGAGRRVIAFFVSIPILSFETARSSSLTSFGAGMASRRIARMLDLFLKKQMSSTDLVAIERADLSSPASDLLGSFTSDGRALEVPAARAGQPPLASPPIKVFHLEKTSGEGDGWDASNLVGHNAGVLASLDRLISTMEALPGRKLLFFVGNIRLMGREADGRFAELNKVVERVVEHANRAEVTLYCVNPYGSDGMLADLDLLARATGGSVIGATELLSENLGKILNRNRGFYLLGFEPQGNEKRIYQKIRVRVKRKGLDVTSRPVAFVKDPVAPPNRH